MSMFEKVIKNHYVSFYHQILNLVRGIGNNKLN